MTPIAPLIAAVNADPYRMEGMTLTLEREYHGVWLPSAFPESVLP
jgi:hypothetical protein